MKRFTSALAGVGVAMVSLLCAGSAQAGISTLYQWNMGDNDGVAVGDPAPATTSAIIGGATANLAMDTTNGGTGVVINSATAALGMQVDGGPYSKYFNTSLLVAPADNQKWGFDAVVKAANTTAQQWVMGIGAGDSASMILVADGANGWAVFRPGAAWRTTSTSIDTSEHHLVYAGGALYMDGVEITNGNVGAAYAAADFTPVAGVTIGQAAANWYSSGFAGAVSFARVFEWTGDFNINDVTVPAIPEPGTVGLLAAGLVGLLGASRRKRA